jgi:formamidopyrimidine-DNA glycosylase
MPELPEVEVVRRGLDVHVTGRTLTAVEVLHPRPVRRDPRGPSGFAAALVGRRVEGVRRRGKYFWLALDDGDALLGHLGMSGQMLLQPVGAPDERHLRVRFGLSARAAEEARPGRLEGLRGPESLELRFVDQRMFGGLLVSAGGAELPPEIAHIARDPLDPEFDDDSFVRAVRRRTAGIKRLLLDQGLVSGVGNIYADEALWRARVHGDRPGERLTRAQAGEVLDRAREVMAAALEQGGTSFDALYVNVNGESGYFDRALHAYGQEGRPCDRCGAPIRRVAFMNRSSYFCPRCQPPPRRRRPAPSRATAGPA